MRAVLCVMALVVAGCSFDVVGTNVDPSLPVASPSPSPTQSVPNGPDGGATKPTPPPPATGAPDMAVERVGTACTVDAECDPGLTCVKSFGAGPGRVDIPGGYCTLECSSAACPANSMCVTFTFGKYCASTCPPDPCRTSSGYVCCDEGNGQNACTPTALCGKGKEG
ncbi:MAG: hypothetical protein LC659_11135 [Myxococcales bacterium]|nr:hypothetical protein [Myxococcales bacterium]